MTVTTESDKFDTLGTESNPYYTYQIRNRYALVFREADFSNDLLTNIEQVCDSELLNASLTIEAAEDGVDYNVYNESGILVANGIGTDSDLALVIGAEFLSEGENSFTIKASRGGCSEIELNTPVEISLIKKPVLDYNENENILFTEAIGDLQWFRGDEILEGENSSSLILDNYYSTATENYSVTVSNDNCNRKSEVFVVLATGEELSNSSGIEVFPNPVEDKFYIKLDNSNFGSVLLRVHSSNGRLIDERTINNSTTEINTNSYENGIYLIEIISDDKRFTKRIVKQ